MGLIVYETIRLFNYSFRPLCLGGAHEPAFCKSSSCFQSSYLPKFSTNVQILKSAQILGIFKWITQKIIPHFPLSFTASSNLPSAMAVVTSLVWRNETCYRSEFLLLKSCYSFKWRNLFCTRERFDSPLAHTPWGAAWQLRFQTDWRHMPECLVWPPAKPSQLPHPSCWPEVRRSKSMLVVKQAHLCLFIL